MNIQELEIKIWIHESLNHKKKILTCRDRKNQWGSFFLEKMIFLAGQMKD